MKIEHIIKLKEPKTSTIKGAGASNDFMTRTLNRIEIYPRNFNYRNNVSYKRVAENMNNYFLVELICALSREYGNPNFLYCMGNYDHCPLENIWAIMKLRIY